ncbi:uncharacterized protein LOC144238793, partial [Crocuta crocuta]
SLEIQAWCPGGAPLVRMRVIFRSAGRAECAPAQLQAILAEAKQSEVDPQGRSDTRRNTGVVTVSPVGSLSSSPVTWAAELTAINSTKASLRDENDPLQLQRTSTSAYYTYILLLAKSMVYSILIVIGLLGRAVLGDNGKGS